MGIADVIQGQAGATFARPPGADEHVFGYAPVPLAGWGLVIEEPWRDVVIPMLQYTLLAPLIVLAAAITSLAALYFGLRRVIRPLHVLGRQASRLACGDFQGIRAPAGGIGEIEEFQRILQEMAAQVGRYHAGMHDYIAALTQAQEEERRRLARELHDETVQGLIALSQRVTMLEYDVTACASGQSTEAVPNIQQRLADLSALLKQSLQNVRHLIRDLRPVYLEELGLVSAEVEDDGDGFVPPAFPSDLASHGHCGLAGMRERATRLGGHLSIRSSPGHETKMVAFLPYDSPCQPALTPQLAELGADPAPRSSNDT